MKKIALLLLLFASSFAFSQSSLGTDPCQTHVKIPKTISVTTNTQLVTGTTGTTIYVCAMDIVVGAATNVAIVEGTGSTCATNVTGMFGGSTAATGWNFGANGGIVKGVGGFYIGYTFTAADNVCILVSAANQVSGSLEYVQF